VACWLLHLLPREAYASEEFFAWECAHLFRPGWTAVAHVSQLPLAGDFINLDFLGEPLIVVRDKSGSVRVLSRACPHRGMDIMPPGFGHDGHGPAEFREGGEDRGHTRLFLCPYHSWTFELDGGLKACPEMGEAKDFCRADWGLKEFRSEIWNGFVFVNLDGTAEQSVADQYALLTEEVARWDIGNMHVVFESHWDIACNWKILAENFMESYHHAGTHIKTLQPIMPARGTWTEDEKADYIRCHLPPATCHLPPATCHLPPATCHLPPAVWRQGDKATRRGNKLQIPRPVADNGMPSHRLRDWVRMDATSGGW
jgi:phenylpropionate dioxygenase-like ring-hydroxylating dioxygenase large terminal subunit